MSKVSVFYLGILATVATSYLGFSLLPHLQSQNATRVMDDAGVEWPQELTGAALKGREAYVDLGCIYCHTQQVRPEGFGADLERGWGSRRTVVADYAYEKPHLLGTMRTGPDLADVGSRLPTEAWHLIHLYYPPSTSKGSNMAHYPFLFEVVEADERSPYAFKAPEGSYHFAGPNQEVWIEPKDKAMNLVAYLLSLKKDYEAPVLQEEANDAS